MCPLLRARQRSVAACGGAGGARAVSKAWQGVCKGAVSALTSRRCAGRAARAFSRSKSKNALYTCFATTASGVSGNAVRALQMATRSSCSVWRAAVRVAYRRSWARRLSCAFETKAIEPARTRTQRKQQNSILTTHPYPRRGAKATRRHLASAAPLPRRVAAASETSAPRRRHRRRLQASRRHLSAP